MSTMTPQQREDAYHSLPKFGSFSEDQALQAIEYVSACISDERRIAEKRHQKAEEMRFSSWERYLDRALSALSSTPDA